ncbi:hypothetical protein [Teichococcus aerofrigidensis]
MTPLQEAAAQLRAVLEREASAARQARLGLWSHLPGAPRAWRERP